MQDEKKINIMLSCAGKSLKKKWKKYLEISSGTVTHTLNQLGTVVNLVSNIPSNVKSALVVGSGDGTSVQLMGKNGIKAKGITIAPTEVTCAKRKGLDVELMDMHHIKFKPNSFDLVFSKDCFKQSMSPVIVWGELTRVASKYILISEPDNSWEERPHNYLLLTKRQFKVLADRFGWKLKRFWTLDHGYVKQRNFLFEPK